MKILITGPQGSGKTTQAQILAKKLNVPLVDTGEMLRQMAAGDASAQGREIKAEMSRGELVDDKVAASLVASRLDGEDCRQGYVMDGYPRSMVSLELFNPEFDKIIYLQIPDEEVEKRLLLRGRADDTPEAIRERLELYHQKTEPVLDYYQKQGKLIRVDGRGGVEQVAEAVDGSLGVGAEDEQVK